MMNKIKKRLLTLLTVLFFSGNAVIAQMPVIFDTDIGNDIDDVLALQMLFNYEKASKIKLLGITISKSNPRVIDYLDGYCRLNKRNEMPLGYAYNGVNPENGKYVSTSLDTLIGGKKILFPKRSIKSGLPEGYKLLRKLLASQKDRSVTIIAVGPETNIANLINSKGDEYSPLTGVELVRKKVKLLSLMGGEYSDAFDFSEWNIEQDVKAATAVFAKWPTEIVASGYEVGNKLLYPYQSILNDFKEGHPLPVSYKVYSKVPYDRQTWDLTSVLHTVEPDLKYFGLSAHGNIVIDDKGKSVFTQTKNGKHRYLTIEDNAVERTLQALVRQVTDKK